MRNKILHFLKTAEGYLSGEEISRQLKITRAGIWKYMQELRKDGYEIEAQPHLGYRIVSLPDKMFPAEIQDGLKTIIFGKDIVYFDSTSSTMTSAFQLGVDGADEGTLVCAEGQTQGKGRMGRTWSSPKGKGVYMSLILRPKLSANDASQLTLLSAVAVCEAIRAVANVEATIKWPNDILIKGKKIAGILTELSAEMDQVRFVVVGIGVNVNTSLKMLLPMATSLKNETGKKFLRVSCAQRILEAMEGWYFRLQQEGFDAVLKRWKELSSTIGSQVRVEDLNGSVQGEAIDLDEYGRLIIRNDDGELIKRMTGDVIPIG